MFHQLTRYDRDAVISSIRLPGDKTGPVRPPGVLPVLVFSHSSLTDVRSKFVKLYIVTVPCANAAVGINDGSTFAKGRKQNAPF